MRVFALVLAGLLLLAGLAGGWLWLWGQERWTEAGPAADDVILDVPKGSGIDAIATILHQGGVVADARVFKWGTRITGMDKSLKAGEYLFPAGTSALAAAEILVRGRQVVRRITLAEGLTVREIVDLVMGAEGLEGLPGPLPDEGSLLPETYHYTRGDSREALLGRMKRAMDDAIGELWEVRAPGLPLENPRQALILASIIEKETGVGAERPLVAGVFINRLKKGMRLQSDPTVAYGLTMGETSLDRPLARSDLNSPTEYNTYVIPGLPPGPICNPGRASLHAALNPEATDAFYFVADGSGGHAFAATLAEHNRNVARWRKIQREEAKEK